MKMESVNNTLQSTNSTLNGSSFYTTRISNMFVSSQDASFGTSNTTAYVDQGNESIYRNISLDNDNVPPKSLAEVVVISFLVTILSLLTILGNLLVIIAFKIEKQLQTISNYFLLSLAVADMAIGFVSMPLYTVYLLMGYWPLGPVLCDIWLSLDYLMSNASAANLMLISFDRYFSVTRPLTYRAKRTTKKVGLMIGFVWLISLILWPPWIFAWPYLEGKRTVPETECYIQFMYTNSFVTIGTHMIAFWIPVAIMCILYFKIYRETERRQKRMPMLQATKGVKGLKKRLSGVFDSRRKAAKSWHEMNPVYDSMNSTCDRSAGLCTCCKIDEFNTIGEDKQINPKTYPEHNGYSVSLTKQNNDTCHSTSFQKGFSKEASPDRRTAIFKFSIPFVASGASKRGSSLLKSVSLSSQSPLLDETNDTCTFVIIPERDCDKYAAEATLKSTFAFSKMGPLTEVDLERQLVSVNGVNTESESIVTNLRSNWHHTIPLSKCIPLCQKRIMNCPRHTHKEGWFVQTATSGTVQKVKKKKLERKQDRKAAKTLSAILMAFIITWLPYQIIAIIESFHPGLTPLALYNFAYWFCYINSTVNPVCYALCNANFRKTFWKILTCTHRRNYKSRRHRAGSIYSFGNPNR